MFSKGHLFPIVVFALFAIVACAPGAQPAAAPAPAAPAAPIAAPKQPGAPAPAAPAAAPREPAGLIAAAQPTSTPVRQAAAQAKYGGTFRTTYTSSSPVGWEPLWSDSASIHTLYTIVGGHLVKWGEGPGRDPTAKVIEPDAAEKWEISGDGLTYTFHLRKGLMLHPPLNREVVSQDVKFAIERYFCKNSGHRDKFDSIKSIELPDKYTVVLKLKEPDADLLENLGNHYVEIHFKDALEPSKDGCYEATGYKNIVGFGPFMKGEFNHGINWTLVRNPNYYIKGLPYLDAIEWIVMPDASTRLAAIRTGQIDVNGLNCKQAQTMAKTNPEIQIKSALGMGNSLLGFNVHKPPFSDVRVRQALSMAIDRKAWLDAFNCGEGVAAVIAVPPGQAEWFLPAEKAGPGAKNFEYNPEGAKKLLAEAGYAKGLNTSVACGYVGQYDAIQLMMSYWDAAGAKTKLDVREYTAFVNTVSFDQTQVKCYGFGRPDIYSWIFVNYHHTARKPADTTPFITKEMDPKLMEMVERQKAITDFKKRQELIFDIQRHLAEKVYYIMHPVGYSTSALAPNIRDYNPHGGGWNAGHYMYVWKDR